MKKTYLCLLLLGLGFSIIAQENTEGEGLKGGTIQSQYDYIWNSSNNYQSNKVVKMSKLNKFNENIKDSLNSAYSEINSLESSNQSKSNEITSLELEKDSLSNSLDLALESKESFDFLGVKTSKSSFKFIFFLVTGILLAISIFSVLRMRSKSSQSSEDKSSFSLLEIEFEEFKKKAREKEQVLARQLQDEINKGL